MSRVQWVDLTDARIERRIMAVIGDRALTDTRIHEDCFKDGFTMSIDDDHILIHYICSLVKKGFLKTCREGGYDYYWKACNPNPFARNSGIGRKQ